MEGTMDEFKVEIKELGDEGMAAIYPDKRRVYLDGSLIGSVNKKKGRWIIEKWDAEASKVRKPKETYATKMAAVGALVAAWLANDLPSPKSAVEDFGIEVSEVEKSILGFEDPIKKLEQEIATTING